MALPQGGNCATGVVNFRFKAFCNSNGINHTKSRDTGVNTA
jgi:hypothetical protein